jgi:hypothetical protein
VLPLTPLQYVHFKNWAENNFVPSSPRQEFVCEALTRIALAACSGGAFYPGIETPRIMRGKGQLPDATVDDIYHDVFPFRIDWTSVRPGDITAGLAVPWQADFYECSMERDNAWWPVTRPDHVLVEQPTRPVDSISEEMYVWSECVRSPENMIDFWSHLGVVRRQRVAPEKVPTNAAALKEFRSSNYDEVSDANQITYYYRTDAASSQAKIVGLLTSELTQWHFTRTS